ncbi:plexin-A2-like isoform X2 [Halichondria panicea]|uniref:plexin-A2-like isoform X2 n=1 Tax=Halichondria panicea TaxID=6063 RepID=UPI00312B8FA2
MAMLVTLFALFLLQGAAQSQSFSFQDSTNVPGLQVDSSGRTFLAAGNYLYRLNLQLVQEERIDLGATVINRGLALSSTGMVVVCLEDLSCSVYNASNLGAGPIRSVSNAIASANPNFGAAIITSGDTVYTGASTGAGERMVLQQFGEGFNRSSDNNRNLFNGGELIFGVGEFSRQFYGGFVSGNFTYYVVSDYQPADARAIRLLRICNMPDCGGPSTCGMTALYELGFNCGSRSISGATRVCGVSLVEDFSGISGPTAVVTICTPGFTTRNSICVVNITAVNEAMDTKYDSCIVSRSTVGEDINIAWKTITDNCNALPEVTGDRCDTPTPIGILAPDGSRDSIAPVRINFGGTVPTTSIAVKMEQFSFVFVATDDSRIRGYDVSGTSTLFYNQPVTSLVHQLSWQEGLNYITATTNNSVFQVPIEECSQRIDCTSCTNNLNPLCGWCVVENKCSRQTQCQNSSLSSRWTQDNTNCVTATVEPMQPVLDPEISVGVLTVALTSPGLPFLLAGETFSCHLADSEGRFPPITVPAVEVTQGTVYNCSITGMVPDYHGVTATINLGFQSSLFNEPFDITNQALTIYRCSAGESCKDCLGLDSPCGWCNLNKQCSGTSAPCRNVSHFLQVSGGNNFTAECPLLDTPPSSEYTQPIRVAQDLRLTTKNLISPTDGFEYYCVVNGVSLIAQYENKNSILCTVGSGQLTLPAGVGSSTVDVKVMWSGNGINHLLSSIMQQTNVTLYDCRDLASGCSECLVSILGSEFTCGWCVIRESCEVLQECTNDVWVTEGRNCPTPFINSISPESGPVEGGTAITVMGTDLGVTFVDVLNATLTLGGVACTPINTDYIPGRQFVCVTNHFGITGFNVFTMVLYGNIHVNVNADSFIALNPIVSSVKPTFGPMAGGTKLTVGGKELGTGNLENTRVTIEINGGPTYPCSMISVFSQEIECTATAANLTSAAEVVVTIDAARLTFGVVFSYRNNPNVTAVFPSNTIPSGGITLTFTGLDMNVVQQPVLEVYRGAGSPLRSYCIVVNSTAITCCTPSLGTTSLTPLNYSLLFDDAPPTTQARLPIIVQSDPFNFTLEGSQEVTSGTVTLIRIVGDNLDSVETSEIRVTVGGEECVKIPSNSRGSDIICTVPLEPPGGQELAIINVTIGSNISQVLDRQLTYSLPTFLGPTVPLEIIIPVIVVIFVLVVCLLMIVIVCLYLNSRRKFMSIAMHQQMVELVATTGKTPEAVDGNNALVKSELDEIAKSIPDSFKIPASILKLSSTAIGQGEFGVVYKGILTDWNKVPMQGVAVKTLKGLFSLSDVQSMVCEVNKMQDFDHPHVMSLIGVCLDAGPGIAIVMPYMANGSLFDYLKKERDNLELDDDCEIDQILAVRKLLLKMCHQIALGMAYLAEQKFVHRDLAARNCMLDSGGGIRVGDFGLAEDVYASGYFRQNDRANVKVPYKWMALESLNDAIFTEKTDVWSYGVTVWEVFNGGRTPYPAVDPLSLIQLLGEGRRLERPLTAACATEISVVMRKCWREDPEERPTFLQLSSIVERLLASISGYTELGMVLVDTSKEEEELKYDYVPTPTEASHRYGNFPLSDPLTTDNSAYGLREEITT